MAAAISTVFISSRCSQLTLFHSKLFLRPSSLAHELSLPGSSALLSHAIKVVAPGACNLNSIQCRVYPPARYKRFRVILCEPSGKGATKKQLREFYIQTLAKVVGSDQEAKEKIRRRFYKEPFGFECEIDVETSKKIAVLPGVLKVLRV